MRGVILLIVLVLAPVVSGQVKNIESGFENIRPFETGRSAVETKLGKPKRVDGYDIYEENDSYTVRVFYSGSPCSDERFGKGEYRIKPETVIEYSVYLKNPVLIGSLQWDKEHFKKTSDPHIGSVNYYSDDENGITFTTSTDKNGLEWVGSFTYQPPKNLIAQNKCPSR